MRVYLQLDIFTPKGVREEDELQKAKFDVTELAGVVVDYTEDDDDGCETYVLPWSGPLLEIGTEVVPVPHDIGLIGTVGSVVVFVSAGTVIMECAATSHFETVTREMYEAWVEALRAAGWLLPSEQSIAEREQPCDCPTCQMERMVKEQTKSVVADLGATIADRLHRRRHDQHKPGQN